LPHDQGEPVQRQQPRLAEALYPDLVPPKPTPVNRPREPEMSLAARADADPWFEYRLAMAGLIRKR
jgi:hypothetical protein